MSNESRKGGKVNQKACCRYRENEALLTVAVTIRNATHLPARRMTLIRLMRVQVCGIKWESALIFLTRRE
jgi:hypothetical protein